MVKGLKLCLINLAKHSKFSMLPPVVRGIQNDGPLAARYIHAGWESYNRTCQVQQEINYKKLSLLIIHPI